MGLVSKIFGADKKIKVCREAMQLLLIEGGMSERQAIDTIKKMSDMAVLGTPVASIVTNIDTIIKSQKSGALIGSILAHIENHRRKMKGGDDESYEKILKLIKQSPGEAVVEYVFYRHKLESPVAFTEEQFAKIFSYASQALR